MIGCCYIRPAPSGTTGLCSSLQTPSAVDYACPHFPITPEKHTSPSMWCTNHDRNRTMGYVAYFKRESSRDLGAEKVTSHFNPEAQLSFSSALLLLIYWNGLIPLKFLNKDRLNFWLLQIKLLAVGTEQTLGCRPLSDEQIQPRQTLPMYERVKELNGCEGILGPYLLWACVIGF